MAERMKRMWAPIDTGVIAVSAGVSSYFLVASELEASLDREVRAFTVTRVICKIWVTPQVADDPVYLAHGLRIENDISSFPSGLPI